MQTMRKLIGAIACLAAITACAKHEYKPQSAYEQPASINYIAGEKNYAALNVLMGRNYDDYHRMVKVEKVNEGRVAQLDAETNGNLVFLSPGINKLTLMIRANGGRYDTLEYQLNAQPGMRYQLGIDDKQAWIADVHGQLIQAFPYAVF